LVEALVFVCGFNRDGEPGSLRRTGGLDDFVEAKNGTSSCTKARHTCCS